MFIYPGSEAAARTKEHAEAAKRRGAMSAAAAEGVQLPPGRDPMATVEPSDIHVLLVDDERLSRIVVGGLLRKCHYKGEPGSLSCRMHRLPERCRA